jgi:para-aminobenzoate synthetase component 1
MSPFSFTLKEIPYFSPLQVLKLLSEKARYFFLLHSAWREVSIGRYSLMGWEPFMVVESKNKWLKIREETQSLKVFKGDPFEELRELLRRFSLPPSPLPFIGGAVGYLSYDLGNAIEKLPSLAEDDLGLPDYLFGFYDVGIIFDHLKKQSFIVSTGYPEGRLLRAHRAQARVKEVEKALQEALFYQQSEKSPLKIISPELTSNFTKEAYLAAVRKVKEYIAAGDVYQINLSQRFTCQSRLPLVAFYQKLCARNPAPFSCFLKTPAGYILSISPERFLLLENGWVETRPIKGTRPRGATPQEDERQKYALLRSEKDRAELIMIVDLLRNDLGRVCEYGSIYVPEIVRLESHPTVFHSLAIIKGKLKAEADRIDLIKACFPGGSITGAPKIRAMEIIEELEPTKRAVYTGSIGYLSFCGRMDLNIAIRTILIKNDFVYFQVGGGIVADSNEEVEYEETLHKGKAIFESLGVEEKVEV